MNGITIDWSMIDWKWLLTTGLAVYAAVLSTYREVQSRQQWRARLKVRLNLNVIAMFGQAAVPQVQVWVENHGRSDVLFNSASVSIGVEGCPRTLALLGPMTNTTFPHTLKPGGSFYVMQDRAALQEGLHRIGAGIPARIRALVHDAIDRPFYSDWQDVSPSQLA